MNEERVEELRNLFQEKGLNSFLVNKPTSLLYLFGYTGTNGLGIVTKNSKYFITDFRYKDQSASEVKADEILLADGPLTDTLTRIDELKTSARTGFEATYVNYDQFMTYSKLLGDSELIPCIDYIERISACKSKKEIEYIEKASEITLKVFHEIIPLMEEGVTEKDIAAEITYRTLIDGGDGDAFSPIVLFGLNTSLPHGTPGDRKLETGDLIQLDFGAKYNGYCTDFSRVLVKGKLRREQREIYLAVKESIDRTIEMLKPGIPVKDVDHYAREVIKKRGFDRYFGHSVGHGVGLEIHSLPKLSRISEEVLAVGNVFTIEPGIYLTGSCGIRIEDLISLDENGINILTNTSREIIFL
ncbi:M24 family metallopeptidase [candidate division KSB1 bacterium]